MLDGAMLLWFVLARDGGAHDAGTHEDDIGLRWRRDFQSWSRSAAGSDEHALSLQSELDWKLDRCHYGC